MIVSAYSKLSSLVPGTWFTIASGHLHIGEPGTGDSRMTGETSSYMAMGVRKGGWFQVVCPSGAVSWIHPGGMLGEDIDVLGEAWTI